MSFFLFQFCAGPQRTNDNTPDMYSVLEGLSASMSDKLESNAINKIAVMNYADLSGSNQGLSKYIVDEITLQLFLKEKFQIIEREQIDYIVNEQKLSSSGLVDDASAIEIGNILSVEALVLGDISESDGKIILNTKVISSQTGQILFLNKTSFLKDNNFSPELDQQDTVSEMVASSPRRDQSDNHKKGQTVRRLGRVLLGCLKENDYECYSQFRASKDQLRKVFLMMHSNNKALRKSKIKNINSEFRAYKKAYKKNFSRVINHLERRDVNWNNVKVEKIESKIIKDYDRKKLFKVDVVLKEGRKHIHFGFKAFKLNGKWVIYNLDMKRNK